MLALVNCVATKKAALLAVLTKAGPVIPGQAVPVKASPLAVLGKLLTLVSTVHPVVTKEKVDGKVTTTALSPCDVKLDSKQTVPLRAAVADCRSNLT